LSRARGGPIGGVRGPHPAEFLAIAALLFGLLPVSCARREPIDGFWNQPWGTGYADVKAQIADLKYRLGGPAFRVESDPLRITIFDAQYGLGYAPRITLDFTPEGALWHGAVRTEITDSLTVDSTLTVLYKQFGKETGRRTIAGAGGRIVWWQTAQWLDRDFYAAGTAPELDADSVRAIDLLYRGCLTDCPIYSIRFLSTGETYFWGVDGTPLIGGFRGRVDTTLFGTLAAEACGPEILALQDYYGYQGPNLNRREARVDYTRLVRTSASVEHCAPAALERFLDHLDSAAVGIAWEQIVSWDTIRIIDQPKVGLDSLSYLGAALGRP
jgi:hypothetical protein